MPEYNLGTAQGTIRITEDASGIRNVSASLDSINKSAEQTGRGLDKTSSTASKFGEGLKRAAGLGVVAISAVAAGVTGLIAKGGLSRALNIQDAQEKLRGLGHDTKSITSIMDSALASVKGTAFGLDEAATTAATAVAAGIKPGKELTKYLKLTADTATIAGSSLGEIGSILNQATSSGVVFTDTLNQLSDRGIPVFPYLQKELGLSGAELRKFVSDGKLNVQTLEKVLNDNLAGAALASGNTTRGALKNVGAAFSRLGAQVVSGPVAVAPKLFQTLSLAIDRFAAAVKPATTALGGFIADGMVRLTNYISKINFDKVVAGLGRMVDYVKGVISAVQSGNASEGLPKLLAAIGAASAASGPALKSVVDNIGPLASSFGDLLASGVKVLPAIFESMAGVLQYLADHSNLLKVAILAVAAAYVLQKASVAAAIPSMVTENALKVAGIVASTRNTQATIASYNARRVEAGLRKQSSLAIASENLLLNAQTIKYAATAVAAKAAAAGTAIFTAATKLASGGLKAFALALTSTGIGAVIVGLGLLAAALIYFFTQTKAGQEAWSAFTRFLGEAFNNVVKVIGAAAGVLRDYLDTSLKPLGGIKGALDGAQSAATGFAKGWNDTWAAIAQAVQPAVDYFQSTIVPLYIQAFNIIKDAVGTIVTTFQDTFSTIIGLVQPTVDFFVNTLGPTIQSVMDTVQQAIQNAVTAISDAWNQLLPVLQPVFDFFTNVVLPVIVPVLDKFGQALGIVAAIIVGVLLAPLALLVVAILAVGAVIAGIIIVIANVITFFANLGTAIGTAVAGIAGFFTDTWNTIVAGIQAFIATVIGIWNGLISFFAGVGSAIASALAPFVNYFNQNVVPVFVAAAGTIQAAVALIQRVIGLAFSVAATTIQVSMAAISSVISSVWNAIVGFVSSAVSRVSNVVQSVFSAVASFVSSIFNAVKNTVTSVWNGIVSVVTSAVNRVVSVARSVLTPIVSIVTGIVNKVRSAFQTGFNAVASVVSSAVSKVVGFVRNGLNPIIGAATSILGGFQRAIQSGINTAIGFFNGIRGKVEGFFGGAASWLYQAGVNVLTGFLNGLKSMFGSITGFLGQVTAAIPQHKGPPSKDLVLLYNSGVLIMTGLQNGLQAGEVPLIRQLDALTGKIAGAVGKGIKDRGNYFQSVGKSITDNLVDKTTSGSTDSLREYLQDLGASITDSFSKLSDARKNASANLAKAKKDAAAKLKDLNAQYAKAKGDRKKTIAKEIADAKKSANDEQAALKALSSEPGADQQSTIAKFLATDNAVLLALADARDKVADQLADAQKALDDATKVRSDYAANVYNAIVGLGDVAKAYNDAVSQASAAADKADSLQTKISDLDASITSAAADRQDLLTKIASFTKTAQRASTSSSARLAALNQVSSLTDQLTALDQKVANYGKTRADLSDQLAAAQRTATTSPVDLLVQNLQSDVDATQKFNKLIDQLKGLGLDSTTYKQVVDDFLKNGDTSLAQSLVDGGKDSVKQIGDLQKQLSDAATALGADTSDSLYTAGVQAAQGIVDGLKSQQDALNAEMQRLAQVMVDSLKKSLGIASPSKRAEKEVGQYIPQGIARGIVSGYGTIVNALQGVGGLLSSVGQMGIGATLAGTAMPLTALASGTSTVNNNSSRTLVYNNYGAPGISSEDNLFQAMRRSRTAVPQW